jgi:hypothetical protein
MVRPLLIVVVGMLATISSAAFPLLTCRLPEHGDEYFRNRAEPADAFQRSTTFATDRVSVWLLHGALFKPPDMETVPSWAWDRSRAPVDRQLISAIESVAAGWPMPCFVMRGYKWRHASGAHGISRDGAFQYASSNHAFSLVDGCVPTRPIWTGVIVNMLFWSGITLLLCRGGDWARRFLRVRYGRCIVCGYDKQGLPGQLCPECGDSRS